MIMLYRCLVCLLALPLTVLSGDERFIYTSFTRIDAFPGAHNERKIRVVGILGYFREGHREDLYLFDCMGKHERRIFGEGIQLVLDPTVGKESRMSFRKMDGKFVEVWGVYVGPRGMDDLSYIGAYLGSIRDVKRIDLVETEETERAGEGSSCECGRR